MYYVTSGGNSGKASLRRTLQLKGATQPKLNKAILLAI